MSSRSMEWNMTRAMSLAKAKFHPSGFISFFYVSPGFRCAPLLQLTLQDRLWAELWARLRRLVYRCADSFEALNLSDIRP